jgi:phage virion morphogenesis protein
MDTLTPRLAALLATLTPAERTRLARRIAADLQKANAARIAAQTEPDGTHFAPRKPQSSRRYPKAQGKIHLRLFDKLRTPQHLKIRAATPDLAAVGFTPRDERIARVHHYGLIDNLTPKLRIRYPIRQLLGITEADTKHISKTILEHLGVAQ